MIITRERAASIDRLCRISLIRLDIEHILLHLDCFILPVGNEYSQDDGEHQYNEYQERGTLDQFKHEGVPFHSDQVRPVDLPGYKVTKH